MRTRTVSARDLDPAQRDCMFGLFRTLYEGAGRDEFADDLANKTHVILLEDRGAIVGFSTIRLARVAVDGAVTQVLFSGDTAIAQAHWGSKALQLAFTRFLLGWRLRHWRTPCHWLLISKGYRTYLLMAHNLRDHAPRPGRELDARQRQIALAGLGPRLAAHWDEARGVLAFPGSSCRVRAGVAPIERADPGDAAVRFFQQRHPGHVRGEELVCLAQVTWADLARALAKYGWRGRSRRAASTTATEPIDARL